MRLVNLSANILLLTLISGTLGCTGPAPVSDYSLAYVSLEAARSAQAAKHAPGFMNQAEDYYKQALAAYEERHYSSASEYFLKAREYAEKAENYTVLKKAETGEVE